MHLKLGIYSDRGPRTITKGPGMQGHEEQDAASIASWGAQYLKVDDMSGDHSRAAAEQSYARIRDALNATGVPIFYSTCGHSPGTSKGGASGGPSWMGPMCPELANACRIAYDVRFWGAGDWGTSKALDVLSIAGGHSGPGAWADPDLLFGSAAPRNAHCLGGWNDPKPGHVRAQMDAWGVLGAPLFISGDVTNMSVEERGAWGNNFLIAVNQDPDPGPPLRVVGGNLTGFEAVEEGASTAGAREQDAASESGRYGAAVNSSSVRVSASVPQNANVWAR